MKRALNGTWQRYSKNNHQRCREVTTSRRSREISGPRRHKRVEKRCKRESCTDRRERTGNESVVKRQPKEAKCVGVRRGDTV